MASSTRPHPSPASGPDDAAAPAGRGRAVDTAGLIRVGILALPVGSALKLVGNLGTFDSIGYGIPQAREAAVVASPGFLLGELFGSVAPVVLGVFGVLALFAYLAPAGSRRSVTAGLVCTVLGSAVTLLGLGVVNYAIPALGHAYLAGDTTAMSIADSFFTWPRGAMFYPAALYPIGAVLFAVAIWRSSALPRSVGVLFAVSAVLIAIPVPLHSLRLAGGVIGLGAGAATAHLVRQRLHPGPDRRPGPDRTT